MRSSLFVFFFILASCSHPSKPKPIVKPVKISEEGIEACLTYQKDVLSQSFSRPVPEARKLLEQFDVTKGMGEERSQLVQNILIQCSAEELKQFDETYKSMARCSLMFSELNFFQSLIRGMKKENWPVDLNLEGKKAALDYVHYYAQGDFPLLNRLIALSVLDDLAINEIVNKSLHPEIKTLLIESRDYVEGLRLRVSKDPQMNCDGLSIIRDELNYSKTVGQKMRDFLKRI